MKLPSLSKKSPGRPAGGHNTAAAAAAAAAGTSGSIRDSEYLYQDQGWGQDGVHGTSIQFKS
jgi:hypothetical protein